MQTQVLKDNYIACPFQIQMCDLQGHRSLAETQLYVQPVGGDSPLVCPEQCNPRSWALGQAVGTGNGSPALGGMVVGQQTTSATS